ncbi:hypothetical protein [Bifidobacterium tibiigranuli]|jgi:molecular chaperone GrpE (heat shock protein)|uniref:hypothetical protein n=1 Tax=Bifidobacterium tibiigranuli TaxID=2172043 RepID=UPI0026F345F6|nr:hypothetical protein [Bifidobacterium tibiigranuli]MCI2185201.1 hypothetical protein [Bifidobacterium tibiigranuli]MCI2203234.1 hypothetical protein [Bifidobacterium tibiigranuli]
MSDIQHQYKRRERLYRHALHRFPSGDISHQLQTIIQQLDRIIDQQEGDADGK